MILKANINPSLTDQLNTTSREVARNRPGGGGGPKGTNISGVAVQHIRFPCYNLIARAGRVGSVTSVNTMRLPLHMAV